MNEIYQNMLKWLSCLGFGIVGYLAPTFPFMLICLFAILVDCLTAWRLSKRVKKRHPEKIVHDKFESEKFWGIFPKMLVVFLVIVLAHMIDASIFPMFDMYLSNCVAGVFSLYEIWSILENESSENDDSWARFLQKFMVNKASRHIEGLQEAFDEMRKEKENGYTN